MLPQTNIGEWYSNQNYSAGEYFLHIYFSLGLEIVFVFLWGGLEKKFTQLEQM